MSAPLISVVIPAYNVARYLPATLDALLGQTYGSFEAIIVDDGSTDDTAAVAAGYAARDPRFRLLRQANSGTAAARNRAISDARGDFLAPLDADDLWRPKKLERQVATILAGGPGLGMVYTWFMVIDDTGHVTGPGLPARWEGDVFPALLLSNFLGSGSCPLIRRQAVLDAGGYKDRPLLEDLEMYLAIAYRWRVAVVPEFLVGYRHHDAGASRDVIQMWRSYEQVLGEAARWFPGPAGRKLATLGGANACLWLARRAVKLGKRGRAIRLVAAAARYAPSTLLGPTVTNPLRRELQRILFGSPPSQPPTHFLDGPVYTDESVLGDHRRMEAWQQHLICRHWPGRRLPCESVD